jgi:hypothetical protein
VRRREASGIEAGALAAGPPSASARCGAPAGAADAAVRGGAAAAARHSGSGARGGLELDQHAAFADLVTELDQHFLDHAGGGGRHVHGGLVGFEGGDGVVHLDACRRPSRTAR